MTKKTPLDNSTLLGLTEQHIKFGIVGGNIPHSTHSKKKSLNMEAINAVNNLKNNKDPAVEPIRKAFDDWSAQPLENKRPVDSFLKISLRDIKMFNRNNFIRNAVRVLMKDDYTNPGYTRWQACGILSYQMPKFKTEILLHVRHGNRKCTNELETILLAIYDEDDDPPVSQNQLYLIAKELL